MDSTGKGQTDVLMAAQNDYSTMTVGTDKHTLACAVPFDIGGDTTMSQEYSDTKRESDPYALPDIEVFELTAAEAVQQDEDLMWQASKQFPLMHMNSRDREKAIDWAVKESHAKGGYFWWACFPGCLPDGPAIGPFKTYKAALKDARESCDDMA